VRWVSVDTNLRIVSQAKRIQFIRDRLVVCKIVVVGRSSLF
jgi:hypothetical protein